MCRCEDSPGDLSRAQAADALCNQQFICALPVPFHLHAPVYRTILQVTWVQAAPYDFLHVDDDLSQEQLDSARAQMAMWTSEGCYPLLPYSSIVLEAVPEQQSQTGRPVAAAQSRHERLLLMIVMKLAI